MGLTNYVMVLFGISVMFYFIGYQPAAFVALSSGIGNDSDVGQTLLNSLYNIFTNPLFLTALGVSVVTSFVLQGGNEAALFIIPAIIFSIIMNLFILPTTYLFDPTVPEIMRLIIGTFLNLFLGLAIVEFVRGGST